MIADLGTPPLHILSLYMQSRILLNKSRNGNNIYWFYNIYALYFFSRILVRMDDNIIAHYSNEAMFVISIQKHIHLEKTSYDITFTELEDEQS